MPTGAPVPDKVVMLTGVAELATTLGLLQPGPPQLQGAAGWGHAFYAVCVFPTNIVHFIRDIAQPDNGLGLGYHLPRMVLQPVLVGLSLWLSGVLPPRKLKKP
jgi:uncharacterized membrane protein